MEGVVCNVNGLDAQVLEGLGGGVDVLVEELADNLVLAGNWPPEELVEEVGKRLHELSGDVDVASRLEDFTVNHFLELGQLVLLGAVKLVGLAGSGVVVQHLLEGLANVDDVDGTEALLHVVRGDDVGDVGQAVEEAVFEAEHGGWADNGGLGIDVANDLLAAGLGAVELGGRVGQSRV